MRKFIKTIRIEGIPHFGAYLYSIIARKSPLLKDLYRNVAEEVIKELDSGKILDVGTGPGYLPLEIAKRTTDIEITGIDLSPTMVKIATKNAKSMRLSQKVKFKVANASSLPFENEYFDFVVSTVSFHHWLQPVKCLKEIHRVLKEKGKAWIYDINHELSEEVKRDLRNKYGLLLSSLFVHVVRAHSSVKRNEVEKVLSSPEIGFSTHLIKDKGVIFKIELHK